MWRDYWAEWRNKRVVTGQKVPFIHEIVPDDDVLGYCVLFWKYDAEIKNHTHLTLSGCCVVESKDICGHLVCFSLHIFDEKDPNFIDFYAALDSKMKELTSEDICGKKLQNKPGRVG